MSYLREHAYPAAKALLQSRCTLHGGVATLIDQCRTDYASPLWDELAVCDYDNEYQRFADWWPSTNHRDYPTNEVEVLFIALEDIPFGFDLRGSTKWSRDPDDWQWWYTDDYSGPYFRSGVMEFAFERSEVHDEEAAQLGNIHRKIHPAGNSWEVVEMFFSLGLFGLLTRELIRNLDASRLLGDRSNRWFVIGHPDAVYGIIMGKLTHSRWQTFSG